MVKIRTATERTLRPLETGTEALSDLDIMTEAALFGFAWLHNQHERMTNEAWREFVKQSAMPFSMRWRFDFAMEQTAEEASRGFPLFFGTVAVSVAGTLEASVRDFARQWLLDHTGAWDQGPVRRIELPAAEFARMSHVERCETLLTRLELALRTAATGKSVRPGVEPLQRLLGALGVAPELTSATTGAINELVAVRNQLLHHGGRVTPRFRELCPQLVRGRRTRLRVTDVMLDAYVKAATDYLGAVDRRARQVAQLPDSDAPIA